MPTKFDAILLIAFGAPEKPEDIRPFLARVTRGRPIPPARIEEVAHHYELIGGRSPLNEITFRQARALEAALQSSQFSVRSPQLDDRGSDAPPSTLHAPRLPVYVGMRNWHPLLVDTARKMAGAGVRRALGLILAPHQSDASWEQYQRNVADAIAEAGVEVQVTYAPPWFDHPLFIEAVAARVRGALEGIPAERRAEATLVFTAHSIPTPMANASPYVQQFTTSARLVAERLQHPKWTIAYQSRSGRPTYPWLEPDICDLLRDQAARGVRGAVVVPIGFVCDHVEVLYDLDIEAAAVAQEVGVTMQRALTVNDDAKFVEMLADVVGRAVSSEQ